MRASKAMQKRVFNTDNLEVLFNHETKSINGEPGEIGVCLLYTSPSPRDRTRSRMPSSA